MPTEKSAPDQKHLFAPAGKVCVVDVDLHEEGSHNGVTDYYGAYVPMGDYADRNEVVRVADEHNEKRLHSMDNVYRVYDEQGHLVHGESLVNMR
jgi:hypothetical protein